MLHILSADYIIAIPTQDQHNEIADVGFVRASNLIQMPFKCTC